MHLKLHISVTFNEKNFVFEDIDWITLLLITS